MCQKTEQRNKNENNKNLIENDLLSILTTGQMFSFVLFLFLWFVVSCLKKHYTCVPMQRSSFTHKEVLTEGQNKRLPPNICQTKEVSLYAYFFVAMSNIHAASLRSFWKLIPQAKTDDPIKRTSLSPGVAYKFSISCHPHPFSYVSLLVLRQHIKEATSWTDTIFEYILSRT